MFESLTLFVVLGFLEEYAGRRVTNHGERVETFGGDEATEAKRFAVYLQRLGDEKIGCRRRSATR